MAPKSFPDFANFFPMDFTTVKGSIELMRKAFYLCAVQIIKGRCLLEKKTFKKVVCEGKMNMYVLNSDDPIGAIVMKKLRGISLAIEKSYVEEVHLIVNIDESDEDRAIEVYSLQFAYDPTPVLQLKNANRIMSTVHFTDRETTVKEMQQLLQHVKHLTNLLPPLPEGAFMSFRSVYLPSAPEDFLPDCWSNSETLFYFDEAQREPGSLDLETVNSKHRSIGVSVQSVFIDEHFLERFDTELSNSVLEETMDTTVNSNDVPIIQDKNQKLGDSVGAGSAHSKGDRARLSAGANNYIVKPKEETVTPPSTQPAVPVYTSTRRRSTPPEANVGVGVPVPTKRVKRTLTRNVNKLTPVGSEYPSPKR